MSSFNILPCGQILNECFGDVVQKVANYLLKQAPSALPVICAETGLSFDQVKKVLCALLQQNIVSYERNKRGVVEYSIQPGSVLTRVRFPKFIYSAKTLYGDIAEILVEELLAAGQLQMSLLIEKVKDRLATSMPDADNISVHQVKEKFVYLAKTHFIQRCSENQPKEEDEDESPDRYLYEVPDIDLELLAKRKRKRGAEADASEPDAKRQKTDQQLPDETIYWRVNYERFDQYLRDQELIKASVRKIDRKAGEVLRTILRLSEVVSDNTAPITNPVSATEIYNAIPKEICAVRPSLDQYLSVLSDDSTNFVQKVDESGGGMYRIDFKKAFQSLATAHVESVVQERFGSKCLRIFRLLMLKKHLEQKQIEECAMIPAKEAKEMLYTMFGQHFIHLTEIPKTPDHAPARTFYLFSVDLNQIARMLLQRSYKTLYNLMCRREHETKENRRVLEKQQRVDAILGSLEQQGADATQKEEVEEMITAAERVQLTKIKHVNDKLEKSELQLDNTIFVLEKYLHYEQMR